MTSKGESDMNVVGGKQKVERQVDREIDRGKTNLLRLQTRWRELGSHAPHVEVVEVDADVDLAGGDAVYSDTGP